MDIIGAIRFVSEDDQWVSKILLGPVISLIPFFGTLAQIGHTIAVLQNVRGRRTKLLPSSDQLELLIV
jgi:hypothetical protein